MRVRSAALLTSLLLALGAAPARADVVITVDKDAQRMSVVVDGTPRYSWPVSTGAAGYDTPSGSFRPFRMERTHFSKEFDDAPMPYATFFTNQGHAIHGTNHVRSLGRAVSHGCVRLSVRNAATLFTLVKAQGMNHTQVRIEGEGAAMAEGGSRTRTVARGRGTGYGVESFDDDQTGARTVYYAVPARRPVAIDPRGIDGGGYGPAGFYDGY
ncbi:L,D-transpeptidase [Methylobacterium sp. J-067]|uniref:L,D-transpeptidase n=1 Tax=Methylobacterium sp. J-067 TaxID=2836648 RepID=UPI001FBBADA7|nr:L,D-transpeptidase [Methylobacterium sp. J-067]MCJ2026564.1 L,D-transpeptidase [Methylobacterium sp. J-067]